MTPRPLPSPRAQELLADALEQHEGTRAEWLARACGGDEALAREVAELLAAHAAAPQFLERPAAASELIGHRAGPWRIEALLAEGGMGDVYRAARADGDADGAWRVALKALPRGLDGDALRARFHAERRTLATLAHPHIVQLVDAGRLDDGRPFLAMELVEGEPIDRWCRARGLDRRARVRLLLDVCGAVDHAHRRLVLHCDLKPANVLVTAEGVAKLLDFGIARLLEGSGGEGDAAQREAGGAALGFTPGSASPEQRAGAPLTVASDVFGLGTLLRALVDEPLDRDLAAIVARATAEEPARRYATAAALADDLRAWLERRPVAARDGGPLDRVAKLIVRQRAASVAALVAVVALAWAGRESWKSWQLARDEARLGWRAHAEAVEVTKLLQALVLDARTGDDATLRAALDRAAARLDASPAPWPEVEGRTRAALGRLYLALGDPAAARPHLERALALAESTRGFGRKDVAELKGLIGGDGP